MRPGVCGCECLSGFEGNLCQSVSTTTVTVTTTTTTSITATTTTTSSITVTTTSGAVTTTAAAVNITVAATAAAPAPTAISTVPLAVPVTSTQHPPLTTPITTTADATTTGVQNGDLVADCIDRQDACTEACQTGGNRSYRVLQLSSNGGRPCVGPTDCSGGDGSCTGACRPEDPPVCATMDASGCGAMFGQTNVAEFCPNLCNDNCNPPADTSSSDDVDENATKTKSNVGMILGVVLSLLVVAICVGVAIVMLRKKEQDRQRALTQARPDRSSRAVRNSLYGGDSSM